MSKILGLSLLLLISACSREHKKQYMDIKISLASLSGQNFVNNNVDTKAIMTVPTVSSINDVNCVGVFVGYINRTNGSYCNNTAGGQYTFEHIGGLATFSPGSETSLEVYDVLAGEDLKAFVIGFNTDNCVGNVQYSDSFEPGLGNTSEPYLISSIVNIPANPENDVVLGVSDGYITEIEDCEGPVFDIDHNTSSSDCSNISAGETNPLFQGAGTSSEPYILCTAAQILALADTTNSSVTDQYNASFKLGQNINMSNIAHLPIGTTSFPFKGNFDGNYHTISNITYSSSSSPVGFFGVISGDGGGDGVDDGRISNLLLENVNITSSMTSVELGGLAGRVTGGIIERVAVRSGNLSGGGSLGYMGGLVGLADTSTTGAFFSISESYSNMAVVPTASTGYIGGLAGSIKLGSNITTISHSYVKGTIGDPSFTDNSGGLLGYLNSTAGGTLTVTESYSNAAITADGSAGNAAGIVAKIDGTGTIVTVNNALVANTITGYIKHCIMGPISSGTVSGANNHYSSAITCITSNNGTSSGSNAENYYYNSAVVPLSNWDFTNKWQSNGSSLPTLQWSGDD